MDNNSEWAVHKITFTNLARRGSIAQPAKTASISGDGRPKDLLGFIEADVESRERSNSLGRVELEENLIQKMSKH